MADSAKKPRGLAAGSFIDGIRPDHVIFSFHSLPINQVKKDNRYLSQCSRTAELIAGKLGLAGDDYSVTFQSRMGIGRWLGPYTDRRILELVKNGKKRLVVSCPGFVTDCLETMEEVGDSYRRLALSNGAEAFELVPSLNSHKSWVEAVCRILSIRSRGVNPTLAKVGGRSRSPP